MHLKSLSEGLVDRGHEVTVITTPHPQGLEYEVVNGVHIHYCSSSGPGEYSEAWKDSSLNLLSELNRKRPFDVVWGEHDAGYYYLRYAKKRLGIPMVTTLQQSFLGELRSQLSELRCNKRLALLFARQLPGTLLRYLTRDLFYAGRADAVIAPSRESARDARWEYFLGAHRVYGSVNGVDIDRFRPHPSSGASVRARYGIASDGKLVFTASRLVRGKGIHVLIRALPEILEAVPGIRLLVAGVGPARAQLETLTSELGLTDAVILAGYVPHEVLPDYYNACDLFVYPTLLYEAFGISVAEAMACGRPVVAAESGGVSTSIDDGLNGFLYRPNRVGDLVRLSVNLLNNPELAFAMGRSARAKAEQSLSRRKMLDDTLHVFESVISQEKGS